MARVRTPVVLAAVVAAGTAAPFGIGAAETYTSARTPAGISFYYRVDPTRQYAALNLGWREAAHYVPSGREGVRILGPQMLMAGPPDDPGLVTERLADLIASGSVSVGLSSVTATVRAPAANLGEAVAIMAQAIKAPSLSEPVLARLRQRQAGAIEQTAARAEAMAQQTGFRLVLGNDAVLTRAFARASVDSVGRDDVDAWRRRSFTRDGLVAVASGNRSETEFARIIDDAFADLPAHAGSETQALPQVRVRPQTVVIERETPQTVVYMLGDTTIRPDSEILNANLAIRILGAGSDGRLFKSLRSRLGAAYGASASFTSISREHALVAMQVAVANELAVEALREMRATYTRWFDDGVGTAELATARVKLVNGTLASRNEPAQANAQLLDLLLNDRPVEDYVDFVQRAENVTAADVHAVIKAHMPQPGAFLTVIVAPSAEGLGADCVIRSASEYAACAK